MTRRQGEPTALDTPPAQANLHRNASAKPHHTPATPGQFKLQPTTIANHRSPALAHNMEETVDLLYCSDTVEESSCSRRINEGAFKTVDRTQTGNGKEKESEDNTSGDTSSAAPRRIHSVVVKPSYHRVSYKDALLKPRTFKPRFPSTATNHIKHGWLHEERRRTPRKRVASVWSRLGVGQRSIQDRIGGR